MNNRLVKTINEYCDLYKSRVEIALGDISPDYLFYHEKVIPRIVDKLGTDVNVVAILRNPVERAYSAYLHKVRDMLESLSFEMALEKENERIESNWEFLWYYKTAGLYSKAIEHYKSVFPNFKVILFEDLKENPDSVTKELFQRLKVSDAIDIKYEINNFSGTPKSKFLQRILRNNGKLKEVLLNVFPKNFRKGIKNKLNKINLEKNKMSPEIRTSLIEYYKEDVINLGLIIKRDLSSWIK
jgi:hypothetical protein